MFQKSHICNSFFGNIISGIQSFYIYLDVPVDIIEWANKKWQKRSHILQYSFAQKFSLILRISTYLTLKIRCSRNTAKNLSDFTSQ